MSDVHIVVVQPVVDPLHYGVFNSTQSIKVDFITSNINSIYSYIFALYLYYMVIDYILADKDWLPQARG